MKDTHEVTVKLTVAELLEVHAVLITTVGTRRAKGCREEEMALADSALAKLGEAYCEASRAYRYGGIKES